MPDWTELRGAITDGDVLMPWDDGYATRMKRWSEAAEIKSAVIVSPTSAEEVSVAIKFAVSNKLPLAVCGGGHSTSGMSSSEGMVIHLGKLRKVEVDQAKMTVSFDGGCLWGDVDSALESCGLATVGGAVNHTGVGGLILGGGHGWLTAKYGLAIDNLISVQIVTADGYILEASGSKNPDLFWAVRGAGAQIGVVTRFKSRVFKQGLVWSGTLTFAPDKLRELVAFSNEFHNRNQQEGHCLALAVGYTPDGANRVLSAIPLYHGPEWEAKRYFSNLLSIGSIANCTSMMSIAQINTLQNLMCEYGIRRLQGSGNVTMPLHAVAFQQIADSIWSFHDMYPDLRQVPQGATAYANRGAYYDAVTMFGWTNPALDETVRRFNSKLCAQIRRENGHEWVGHDRRNNFGEEPVGRYLNMEADLLTPVQAYGRNLEKLQKTKRKFDPENIFDKWHGVVEKVEREG
ncbi:FAD-binding domain-containing protein [Penicillium coprophilum]|uniref:FAD-binding domain-containing protein n=1 Tax=Penicillium coprophilum TaxID=36646 RepID=UPI00239E3880|nr:FAD-binding domain-containing protein [Penicillium coprophilum]KAJ5162696.1 FAD-binding domain-containing protein [Penicillium coprophilum]